MLPIIDVFSVYGQQAKARTYQLVHARGTVLAIALIRRWLLRIVIENDDSSFRSELFILGAF